MDWYNGFSPKEREASGKHLHRMVAAGKWSPSPSECVACGRTDGLLQRHREDYTAPFSEKDDTIHLCRRCHGWVHARLAKPEKWNSYRKEVREGWRYSAGAKPTRTFGGIPSRFILDEIHQGTLCPPGRTPGNSKGPTPIISTAYFIGNETRNLSAAEGNVR
jgi:hypothetical protein